MKKFILCTLIALALLVGGMPGCTGLAPNHAEEYYNEGVALSNDGRYDEAIAEYNKAIEIDQNYTNAYVNLGYAYLTKKQYDLSITNYTKAIELDPEQRTAYNGRGAAYLHTKRYNSAALDFNKSIELDPSATQVYTNLDYVTNMLTQASEYNLQGATLADTGEYDEAFDSFCNAIEVYPYYPAAYANRGIICMLGGRYDLAITEFNSALKLSPDYALAYSGRGAAYIFAERYEEAITDLDKALEIDPDEATDWNNKGVALEQLGEYEEASDAYDRALQLEPNNDGIKYNITSITTVIREAGIPKGVKGHYFGPLPYGIEKAAEQRTTETEFEPYTEPSPEGFNYQAGYGVIIGPESLVGEWIDDSPRYGLVISDGGSYWNYNVVLKIDEEVSHTGPMQAEQPSTFTGTMQTTLVSITGPVTSSPDMMSGWPIGQTLDYFISGRHLGSSVELDWAGITLRPDYDGHNFMGGTTNFYEVNGQLTEYKPHGGAAIAWSYSAWLMRKR